jgi:hypothetical protein
MEFFTNLHSLLSFYRLVQTAPQNFLLLFSFSHAGLPAPLIHGLGPDFFVRVSKFMYRIVSYYKLTTNDAIEFAHRCHHVAFRIR